MGISESIPILDRWVNEWMNEWMSEWMNEWVNEWMGEEELLLTEELPSAEGGLRGAESAGVTNITLQPWL